MPLFLYCCPNAGENVQAWATAILGAATLRGLCQEQFGRSAVVEGRHGSTLAQKVMHYEARSLWLPAREVRDTGTLRLLVAVAE
jgi:hypothetical protein